MDSIYIIDLNNASFLDYVPIENTKRSFRSMSDEVATPNTK